MQLDSPYPTIGEADPGNTLELSPAKQRGQTRLPDLRDSPIGLVAPSIESLSIKNEQLKSIKLEVGKVGLPPLLRGTKA